MEDTVLFYISALVIIVISLLIFVFWSRWKNSRRGVLFVGLSDSGKTLMFSRLLHNKFVETYTSIKENIGDYIVKDKHLKIVDIPGHSSLHYKFFDRYKNVAGGIVYVVDSVTFQQDIRDVAEFLYFIMTDPVILSNRPKFLILWNKQDHPTSENTKRMQNMLEKELNTLKSVKSNQLKSTHGTANILDRQNTDFEFSHIDQYISFGETAALNGDPSKPAKLEHLKDWLNSF